MNVYDFDGTIYNGDSSIDFWFFCLSKQPSLIRYFPQQLFGVICFKLGKISKEKFKSSYFSFLKGISNIDIFVKLFWDKKQDKIKEWYKNIKKYDDCIISASPYFLLEEICKRICIQNLIATKVDQTSGQLLGNNCHGKNKSVFFVKHFSNAEIENFYSDSASDIYLAQLAKNAFIVKKNKLIKWEK